MSKNRKTKLLVGIPAGIVILVLLLPLSNLVFGPDNTGTLPKRTDGVPGWAEVSAVLGKKCVHCHAESAKVPFYAGLPIAKRMIETDRRMALTVLDMPAELYRKGAVPLSESAMAKLEFALAHDSMPPRRHVALHWNHGLNRREKALLIGWIKTVRARYFQTPGVAKEHATGPLQPLPTVESLGLDAGKVALGKRLFHDPRLSVDDTVSCASCHDLGKGGTDRLRFSVGVKKQVGGINSPTVYNSHFQFVQFWDGRSPDLVDQAGGPVANPVEMGTSWKDVIPKLEKDEELSSVVKALYKDGFTGANLQDAIATFERSLVTPSRFDAYLRGDAKALSGKEKEGLGVFVKKGCAMCHAGKGLGGQSFEKMGLFRSYFGGRKLTDADLGRYGVTKRAYDKHRFKVPILRNVVITAPYFHDGSTSELRKAVEVMSSHQLEAGLSKGEVDAMLAFLRSLTGTWQGKPLK